MSAEQAARITSARALLADFERATENGVEDGAPSWAEWAGRLSYHVGSLLSEPEPAFDVAAGADPFAIPANGIGEPAASLAELGQQANPGAHPRRTRGSEGTSRRYFAGPRPVDQRREDRDSAAARHDAPGDVSCPDRRGDQRQQGNPVPARGRRRLA